MPNYDQLRINKALGLENLTTTRRRTNRNPRTTVQQLSYLYDTCKRMVANAFSTVCCKIHL